MEPSSGQTVADELEIGEVADKQWWMLCHYGGSGGCFATLIVLPIFAPLVL